jgi:alkylated DNA nucleotide flippase Atl1
VVRAGGEIAFPAGSEGRRRQRSRLEAEGVAFDGEKIDMLRCGWRASLDELLWGPPGG